MDEQNTKQIPQSNTQKADQTPKIWAIIAYLLFFVPLLTESKNDPFVKFHVKQGLILFLAFVVFWLVFAILGSLLGPLAIIRVLYPIQTIVNLGLLALMIIGIYNAATMKEKPLPLIGSFANMFKF